MFLLYKIQATIALQVKLPDKGSQGQLSFGGNLGYSTDRVHIGVNGVHYNFNHTITKANYLYNSVCIVW